MKRRGRPYAEEERKCADVILADLLERKPIRIVRRTDLIANLTANISLPLAKKIIAEMVNDGKIFPWRVFTSPDERPIVFYSYDDPRKNNQDINCKTMTSNQS